MTVEAADGILYTENAIHKKKATNTRYPKAIEAENLRAAHAYNIAFGAVRENFAIAGLLPAIEVKRSFPPFRSSVQRINCNWISCDLRDFNVIILYFFTANNAIRRRFLSKSHGKGGCIERTATKIIFASNTKLPNLCEYGLNVEFNTKNSI